MRIHILALVAIVFCLQGAEAKDTWAVRGEGKASCGTWTAAQKHRPQIGADGLMPVTFTDMDLASQAAWVLGFLSAYDFYVSNTGNVANGIDTNGIFAWIDNYCIAHPLDSIATATIALITEVSKRTGTQQ